MTVSVRHDFLPLPGEWPFSLGSLVPWKSPDAMLCVCASAVEPMRLGGTEPGEVEVHEIGSGFFLRARAIAITLRIGLPVQPRGRLTEKSRLKAC